MYQVEKKFPQSLKLLERNIHELNNNINKEFRFNIFQKNKQEQNNFCNKKYLYYNKKFDKNITLAKVKYYNKKFKMYVYKNNDGVSGNIILKKYWEIYETTNLLKALNYYSVKKNLSNKEIYFIDIGANIGWYTFTLSKFGYKIISFEPSKLNYYILNKNYCINKDENIILINKGLFTEEKKCSLYNSKNNIGNGMIICDDNSNNTRTFNEFFKNGEIELTKLSNYIPFIKNNLALMKIDVEGSEGKVIEGGIELITKYHIPFIFLEFTPSLLKVHGTNPKEFLQMFLNNGYKISPSNFFDKKNYTVDFIIKKVKLPNLYFTYAKILED